MRSQMLYTNRSFEIWQVRMFVKQCRTHGWSSYLPGKNIFIPQQKSSNLYIIMFSISLCLTAWFVKCVTASRWCDWKRIVTFKCLWHNYGEIVVWCCRIESFWCSTTQRYQKLSTKALSILVPFAYLCEQVLEPFEPLVWAALSSCVPRYVQIISEEHQRVAMFALMSSKVWKCVWCIMSSNFNNEDTAKPEVCDSRSFSKRGARTSLFSRRSASFQKGWEPIN